MYAPGKLLATYVHHSHSGQVILVVHHDAVRVAQVRAHVRPGKCKGNTNTSVIWLRPGCARLLIAIYM